MTKIAKISLNTLFMTKIAEKPYSPYKGVPPPLSLGVMHSNIFLFEVTNITVLLCNPALVIINWLTAPHTFFSLYQVSW